MKNITMNNELYIQTIKNMTIEERLKMARDEYEKIVKMSIEDMNGKYYQLFADFDYYNFKTIEEAEKWCQEHSEISEGATLKTKSTAISCGLAPRVHLHWYDGRFMNEEEVDEYFKGVF